MKEIEKTKKDKAKQAKLKNKKITAIQKDVVKYIQKVKR